MIRAPLKTHFFRDNGVASERLLLAISYSSPHVSYIHCGYPWGTSSLKVPTVGATTKKSLFLEAPMNLVIRGFKCWS